MKRKRILIAAGGTGGHFYPGLAVAQALQEKGWQPLIALKPGSAADQILEEKQIAAIAVDLEGMPRAASLRMFRFSFKLLKSAVAARRIMSDFMPDVVLGMGGYVSVPCLLAARLGKIPTAVHESNAILGLANRLCRSLGARVFWGLPPLEGIKSGEALTGTPIRSELCAVMAQKHARQSLGLDPNPQVATLLIFGGSQGAAKLNMQLPQILTALVKQHGKAIQVLHLTGKTPAEEIRQAYAQAPFRVVVLAYLDAMEQAYAAADVVICRAGASTLAELLAQRKPAILIPYPHAAAQHQTMNALVLERINAAKLIEERTLEARLPQALQTMLLGPDSAHHCRVMSESYASLPLPAPAETLPALVRAIEAMAL